MGSRLQAYLDGVGMSRRALSRAAQVDRRTISALCEGSRSGQMQTWLLIARALGCGLDEIIDVSQADAAQI